jgi:hypothetical protein
LPPGSHATALDGQLLRALDRRHGKLGDTMNAESGDTLLMEVLGSTMSDTMILHLVEKADLNALTQRNRAGENVPMIACRVNRLEILRAILARFPSEFLNEPAAEPCSGLPHAAALSGNPAACALVENYYAAAAAANATRGGIANPWNMTSALGTPLELAIKSKQTLVVHFLLARSANWRGPTTTGRHIFQLALALPTAHPIREAVAQAMALNACATLVARTRFCRARCVLHCRFPSFPFPPSLLFDSPLRRTDDGGLLSVMCWDRMVRQQTCCDHHQTLLATSAGLAHRTRSPVSAADPSCVPPRALECPMPPDGPRRPPQ